MLGNPALRRLLFLKARGSVRRQVRRVRTLRGLVLTLFGLFLFGMWIFAVVGRALLGGREADPDPEQMRSLVRLGGLFFCLLNGFGALSHRGLFLPKEEIERLFSAPVRRADLVRYRLQTNLLRSSIGALFIGAVLMMRIPRPLFGFCAVFAGLAMLPVFGQALSILAGSLEKRFDRFLAVPRVVAFAVSIAGVIWLTLAFTVGEGDPDPRNWMGEVALPSSLPELLAQPWLAAVLAPFEPWARAATAQTWSQFLPWIAVCAVAWVMGYELTARIPVDFRELSLETSANVAERIRRVRRVGGGASAAKLSDRAAGLRVPWFFGRGPAGAVAWRKASGILRKARGTLWVSLGVLALLVLLVVATTRSIDEPGGRALTGAALVATLGTLYLCGGLRFDFREDLSRMEDIKAWPLSSWRLFLAMLVPQVMLVSGVLLAGIFLQASILRDWHRWILAIVATLPLVVLAWVALDNAAYLFAPVRMVPGSEGGLQNMGRAVAMFFLRIVLLGVVAVAVALVAVPAYFVAYRGVGTSVEAAGAAAFVAGWCALAAVDAALIGVGGMVLKRFDPARDTG